MLNATCSPHPSTGLQTQTSNIYSGPLDAVKKIYRADGIRGVFHGQGATLARSVFSLARAEQVAMSSPADPLHFARRSEFHGFGMYFLSYEALVAHHQTANGCKRTDIPVPMAAAYGALAGWAMWLTVRPLLCVPVIAAKANPLQPTELPAGRDQVPPPDRRL